ncbi:CsbD family protein [Streptomyces diastatochromogenes]|uniref:CsbD family protein n=1 Tax=Streptomyces diastatochromogenes TaxID=42236 RepID=UPI002F26BE60
MTAHQKLTAKTEQARGAAKEAVGRALGNERMTGEGRLARAKGDLRAAVARGGEAVAKGKDTLQR